MGSFRRAFLGYRRTDVDAAINTFEARESGRLVLEEENRRLSDEHLVLGDEFAQLEDAATQLGAANDELRARSRAREAELVGNLSSATQVVIEREKEIATLKELLHEAALRHDSGLRDLRTLGRKIDEIEAQARGQATRIRMQALGHAAEISRRAQELLAEGSTSPQPAAEVAVGFDLIGGAPAGEAAQETDGRDAGEPEFGRTAPVALPPVAPAGRFLGLVRIDIGPLADFSQLVDFEDAAGQIGAVSQVSIDRFSAGRATLSMRIDEAVELLDELGRRCQTTFTVRRTTSDSIVLDLEPVAGSGSIQAA